MGTDKAARAVEARAWATHLTDTSGDRVVVRGLPLDEAIGTVRFSELLLRLWRGVPATPDEADLIEACLVAAIDHGPTSPSGVVARTAASTRQQPIVSVAAGLLAFSELHGAGVGPCMELLRTAPEDAALSDWAERTVTELRAHGRRVAGVGHRTHVRDLRAERLLSLVPGDPHRGPTGAVRALAAAVAERSGRPIPVNVDGAMAAALVHVGLEPDHGDLLFAVARSAGLAAQVMEERTERPMRTIDTTRVVYDVLAAGER
jgi:citrate synthase